MHNGKKTVKVGNLIDTREKKMAYHDVQQHNMYRFTHVVPPRLQYPSAGQTARDVPRLAMHNRRRPLL